MRTVLLVVAVLLFLLAAFGVSDLDLHNFGLAAFAGSFLVPDRF